MDICNSNSADYSGFGEMERLRASNVALIEENSMLRNKVDELSKQLQHYKLVSQSFEMRVLDLQKELQGHDESRSRIVSSSSSAAGVHSDGNLNEMAGSEPEQFRKLFVGGLSYTTTDQSLREYFSKFGHVTDCVVMKDNNTKRSRGFGFVVFEKVCMVDVAQDSRPHIIDKREVETKRAVPKGDNIADNQMVTKKIFVGGLRDSTDEASLTEYFSRYGKVDHVDLIEDRSTKRLRGFAYVTFLDYDPVDKAVLQKFHTIDGRRCEVKKALSRLMMKNRNNAIASAAAILPPASGNLPSPGWNNGNSWGGNGPPGPAGFDTSLLQMCGAGGGGNSNCSHGGFNGGSAGEFNCNGKTNMQSAPMDVCTFRGRNGCGGGNGWCMGGGWRTGSGGHFCGEGSNRSGWPDSSWSGVGRGTLVGGGCNGSAPFKLGNGGNRSTEGSNL